MRSQLHQSENVSQKREKNRYLRAEDVDQQHTAHCLYQAAYFILKGFGCSVIPTPIRPCILWLLLGRETLSDDNSCSVCHEHMMIAVVGYAE